MLLQLILLSLGMTAMFLYPCSQCDPRLFCNAGIDTGNIVESSRSRRPRVIPHAYTAVANSGSDEDDDEVTFRTFAAIFSALRAMPAIT